MAKENLTALKTLVISMGFLLVGGTVLLAAIVWKKVTAETSPVAQVAECSPAPVDLTGHGTLVETMMEGRALRAVLQKKSGETEVYTINLCSGAITGKFTLKTDAVALGK